MSEKDMAIPRTIRKENEIKDDGDVFSKFKEKFHVSLPCYLENLLKFTGFDNFISLSSLDENDLQQIENIARNQISCIFPDTIEDYLGYFSSNANKFVILPGQKKMLLKIKQFCTQLCDKSYANCAEKSTQTIPLSSYHEKKTVRSISSRVSQTSRESKTSESDGSEHDKKNISENITHSHTGGMVYSEVDTLKTVLNKAERWTEEFLKENLLDNQTTLNKALEKTKNISVESCSKNSCSIKCFLCDHNAKIFKASTGTWLLSNYHRHFKTHLDGLKQQQTKNNRGPKRYSILSFLQKDSDRKNNTLYQGYITSDIQSDKDEQNIPDKQLRINILQNISLPPSNSNESSIESNQLSTYDMEDNLAEKNSSSGNNKIVDIKPIQEPYCENTFAEDLKIIDKEDIIGKRKIRGKVQELNSQFSENCRENCTYNDNPNYNSTIESTPLSTPTTSYLSQHSIQTSIETSENFVSGRVTKLGDINTESNTCPKTSSQSPISSSPSCSRWRNPFYSRCQRQLRKRKSVSCSYLQITDFFPMVDTVQQEFSKLIVLNPEVKESLAHLQVDFTNVANTSQFFKTLVNNTTSETKSCEYKGKRYEKNFKHFCMWLYLTGGKLLYETLHLNLKNIIPGPSTIRKQIVDSQPIVEGQFRFIELKEYLIKNNYPLKVWISEDQTSINTKINYSPKNNQLIGFTPSLDEHGFPVLNEYPFNTLKQIELYFESAPKSNYINIIVCQPLIDKSSSFCLCVYGTNNRFSAEDVEKRWKRIVTKASDCGITVEGFSTDGDCRMLKVMKKETGLPTIAESEWFFIKNNEGDRPLYIQDTIHIGTKLKTVLLKPTVSLRIGGYEISKNHIEKLINSINKDKHSLSISYLNPTDKMNFDSFDKMTQEKVTTALNENFPEAKGTATFLQMSRFILDAFLYKELTPLERIFKMWVATFFFRIWRYLIASDKQFALTKNFISLNCYTCIEINAHSLIQYIKKCRTGSSDNFYPWLLSSQPCEKTFRELRSLTSTFSTVVNFSLFEVLHRLRRAELIGKIANQTDGYQFARQNINLGNRSSPNNTPLPSDNDILKTINEALVYVKFMFLDLGITVPEESRYLEPILKPNPDQNDQDASESDHEQDAIINSMNPEKILEDLDSDDENLNLLKENMYSSGTLQIKDFSSKQVSNNDVSENLAFLKITLNSRKVMLVKKSTLCWLYQSSTTKLSSDRTIRVRGTEIRTDQFPSTENRQKRKRPTDSSSSEEDSSENVSYADSSSLEDFNTDEENNEKLQKYDNNKVDRIEIEKEKYYAVFYDTGWFIGRVLEVGEKVKLKFLKQDLERYVWPKKEDIQSIEKQFIFYGPIQLIGNEPFTIRRAEKLKINAIFKIIKKRK